MATPRIGLPIILASQAQKHITHNEALAALDLLVQASVINSTTTGAPLSPGDGDSYIVASPATGDWLGRENQLAVWDSTQWVFVEVPRGAIAFDQSTATLLVFNVTWGPLTVSGDFSATTVLANRLGIGGATPDATNTFAFSGTNLLLNSAASIDLTFNKNAPGNDASFTYKTGFSARALVGLLGDDDYTIKTTPDGSTYKTALIADKDAGSVSLPQNPKFSAFCNYDQYNAAASWFKVDNNAAVHNDQAALSSGTFTAPHDGYFLFGAGARLKLNAAAPSQIILGFSINGASPTGVNQTRTGEGSGTADNQTSLALSGLLKLSSGDTVEVWGFFATNDAYFTGNIGYFHGHGVP